MNVVPNFEKILKIMFDRYWLWLEDNEHMINPVYKGLKICNCENHSRLLLIFYNHVILGNRLWWETQAALWYLINTRGKLITHLTHIHPDMMKDSVSIIEKLYINERCVLVNTSSSSEADTSEPYQICILYIRVTHHGVMSWDISVHT